MKLTAIIEREGTGFVALCPDLDIASQGDSVEDARDNLEEALKLFFETASSEEIEHRLPGDDDVVILKPISQPSMEEFDDWVAEARREAKKARLKRADINKAVA